MPQVDLETLVSACAGGGAHDRKIACEEALADGDNRQEDENREVTEQPEVTPDVPPESFWLSKDAEYDWLDQNAFYERKDSTKGSSNSTNLNPSVNPATNSNSQRFSLNFKSKASILGLPKLHKAFFVDTKNRRNSKSGNARLFPKQSGSSGKSDSALVEPSSPKVSCMGRVRSKRDRSRQWKNRRHPSEPAPPQEKPDRKDSKRGFFSPLRSLFQGWKKPPAVKIASPVAGNPPATKASDKITLNIEALTPEFHPRRSVEIEPPGLGGVKRYASGRRSGSWVVGDGE
ncbi:uncharacterized protein LOC111799554 [Cucurbita pepo subsp. pepo]|uniref:uncharacterized protein LOC111799554 n=1 Tax=Cucurbita pepo subsp. pepo TaxID=3664 RepID=UPI000C9D70D3|nr:uncharacterized protein LOC111799554 [Cucurbita pepo subsp. pepo]